MEKIREQERMAGKTMAQQEYFKSALSDFTYEAASGGAVRHLTDLGYTVKQICERLSFPTPYARVQKTVWEHLLAKGILLTEEPGSGSGGQQGKAEYAMEYDKYGRTSFRRIAAREESGETICWKEQRFVIGSSASDSRQKQGFGRNRQGIAGRRGQDSCTGSLAAERSRKLAVYLSEKCKENDGEAYISCGFGKLLRRDPERVDSILPGLYERQREYLTGLPWEDKMCYHRLDQRMQEITVKLYAAGSLQECCYFMKTKERVHLG